MIRWTLTILLSFCLLLASSMTTAAATRDSGRRVALGIAKWEDQSLAGLDAFTEAIGRRPAFWTIWRQWGGRARGFPTDVAHGLAARGVTPMIWWEPVNPANLADPTYSRHQNIIRGGHDRYIRQFARDARAFGGPVLLRFAHEPNASYFPWSVRRFDNSAETFVAAWRRVHGIFVQERATNVRFLWSVAKQRCRRGCNPYISLYPGDAYVDVMGVSTHNWGKRRSTWTSMYDGVRRIARHLAAISDKPIMIAEMATSGRAAAKADWIRDGYREVYQRIPRIVAITYLDADLRSLGHPDWRLTNSRKARGAYADIAGLGRFRPRTFAPARTSGGG